ncbi:MAG: hypothetical protein RI907_1901 [Pseudomonadota bacterium]
MSLTRLTPALLDLAGAPGSQDGVPYSPVYEDVYHAQAGAWAQARHVFLGGNDLPRRWQGRERFTVLETGFGLGNSFLATWSAWRRDPQRCEHLFFASVEKHPITAADLARVHGLATDAAELTARAPAKPLHDGLDGASLDTEDDAAERRLLAQALHGRWPTLTPGLHLIHFEGEHALAQTEAGAPQRPARVTLMLALGDVADCLPQLLLQADAFYLDGFSHDRNPAMWDAQLLSRLNRLAAPGATVSTWSSMRPMREALAQAGFVVDMPAGFAGKSRMVRGVFEPRHQPEAPVGAWTPAPAAACRTAIVVGAGLAGAAAAYALCREGWQVTVVDAAPGPARGASGNPAGLFHAIVHGEDGTHTRTHRAAALATHRLLTQPGVDWPADMAQLLGLMRLAPREQSAGAKALLDKLGWPADHLHWLTPDEAAEQAQVPLTAGAWLFGQAGMVNPAMWTAALLDAARVWADRLGGALNFVWGVRAQNLAHDGTQWRVEGRTPQAAIGPDWRAHAHSVLLCNAHAANELTHSLLPHQASVDLPLSAVRGQTTILSAQALADLAERQGLPPPHRPDVPLAGNGYALSLPDGGLLLGATTQHHDRDPSVRDVDHRHNLLQAVDLGVLPKAWAPWAQHLPDAPTGHPLLGRTQWRATTPDRLPLVGALPWSPSRLALSGNKRPDQVRLLPRIRDAQGGLYVVTGLGSRGLTWTGLLVELVAHWVAGAPCPVELDLRDAMDPARFLARLHKKPA